MFQVKQGGRHVSAPAGGGAGGSPFHRLKATVLLVDDEQDVLDGLRHALRHSDFRVITACGPAEALQVVAREQVDIVITDLRMPEMDGLELLDTIRERRPEALRLILTGHGDARSAITAINDEAVFRYLEKPISRDQLVATLQLASTALQERRELARLAAAGRSAAERDARSRPNLSDDERVALRTAMTGPRSDEVVDVDAEPVAPRLPPYRIIR